MAYVYGHYRESDGKLFYIGKGIGNRAWDKIRRNRYWFRVVNKHGLIVKIIEDNLTEELSRQVYICIGEFYPIPKFCQIIIIIYRI